MKPYHNREWLCEQYWGKSLHLRQIAKQCKVHHSIIHDWMKRLDIPRRTQNEAWSGRLNPRWKGGRVISKEGYVLIFMPEHPDSSGRGYICEHRLIAEKALGRRLRLNEVPHHINGIVDDNRNDNLLVCTTSYHAMLHNKLRGIRRKNVCG